LNNQIAAELDRRGRPLSDEEVDAINKQRGRSAPVQLKVLLCVTCHEQQMHHLTLLLYTNRRRTTCNRCDWCRQWATCVNVCAAATSDACRRIAATRSRRRPVSSTCSPSSASSTRRASTRSSCRRRRPPRAAAANHCLIRSNRRCFVYRNDRSSPHDSKQHEPIVCARFLLFFSTMFASRRLVVRLSQRRTFSKMSAMVISKTNEPLKQVQIDVPKPLKDQG
jgi:hypothetical protein